jgi:hypothetical protein
VVELAICIATTQGNVFLPYQLVLDLGTLR